jgi:Flp pilus assembly protein TadD
MLAIEHFTSAMNSTSNEKLKGVYIHERAKALQLERRYDEAIVDFSYVIQRNPNNAHAYFRRGFAYKAIGELTLAASDIQTARLLDPHNDKLVVNFKEISDIECIIICPPGEEVVY